MRPEEVEIGKDYLGRRDKDGYTAIVTAECRDEGTGGPCIACNSPASTHRFGLRRIYDGKYDTGCACALHPVDGPDATQATEEQREAEVG